MKGKTFKETKLGKFLSEKVPGVLDVVDDYFPPAKILTALVGKNLPPEDQLEFEKLLREHEKEVYALEQQDKSSARTREVDFIKVTGHIDWMQTIVGITVMVAFIGALFLIGFKQLPSGSEHLMINAIGIMEGLVLSVVGYYYGSSAGSRIKDMKK